MLTPNVQVQLLKIGSRDKYGQYSYASTPVTVQCAIVKLFPTVKKSAIRTTETASRSEADETLDPAVLLFLPNVGIGILDKVIAYGNTLVCKTVSPQFSVFGDIDHYLCEFEAD